MLHNNVRRKLLLWILAHGSTPTSTLLRYALVILRIMVARLGVRMATILTTDSLKSVLDFSTNGRVPDVVDAANHRLSYLRPCLTSIKN
ncbi:hypothetical protein P3T76_003305 [Phytophthora citrophthora]|uniref:Uncharacterized protein n=1 Tax=Phytophthora citrophthora TaxID=4793 RepID=A0AAD9GUA7_9STRA|nr:hypothetical protein P3T76_003305 [Phytophthora citrophthora]